MGYANTNNFVQWYLDSESDPECFYALPLVAGDTLKVFINFVFDNAVDVFTSYKVGLWNADDDAWYINDIATLNQIVISGDNYSMYFEWTVPSLPKNNFRFYLWNATNNYYSNLLHGQSSTDYTSIVKYRNTDNAMGYRYESVTSFYNQFRIDLWTGRPNFKGTQTGYETYDGDFIKVKSHVNKLVNFETRYLDEERHEAFFAMLMHSEMYIDDIEYKLPSDGEYSINWHDDDDNIISTGAVNLLRVDYSTAVQTC